MVRTLDYFYFTAKKEKFRSRAAFKLIELNRKFKFLNRSKGILDLCCAPGSWLEVAKKLSPDKTLLIGVDIKHLKPLQDCKIIRGDITSPGCKKIIKKIIYSAKGKIDVVLNDGAPKIGTNWTRDSYNQNDLTLKALSLASECLEKNGFFVTKVFRSQFLNRILFVLKFLFEKINIFKPSSSRKTSAEIFLVCQKYKAYPIHDRAFFSSSFIFGPLKLFKKISYPEKDLTFLIKNQKKPSILKFLRNIKFFCKLKISNIRFDDELESLLGVSFFSRIVNKMELAKKRKISSKITVVYFFFWGRAFLNARKNR
mmetsp:Transcript_60621/g.91487  ORF Transcript_60621/g.91487 Transcript_60621/m.91487 type:complete len:312 (-) Transcript_60621:248-1183(-)